MTKIDKHGKYPRAALSLCKWMDKQNIHGEVAYNDPPFPKNNTLFVYLERDEHKDKLPKKWEGLKIVYKGQLPWGIQKRQATKALALVSGPQSPPT